MAWVRLDVDIDTHPDMMALDGWAYVAFTAAIRVVKQYGSAGRIVRKHLAPCVLARRCCFGPDAAEHFAAGLAQLVEAGLVVDDGDEYAIPGWSRYQTDRTNAARQRRHRSRNASNATEPLRALRNANNDDRTGQDMTGHIGNPPNGHDLDDPPILALAADPAPPQKPTDPVDWTGLKDQWNAATADAPGASSLRTWTDARKSSLRARAKEMGSTPAEAWAWVCAEVRTTPLLRGDTGREGRHAGWRVSPDWVLKPANWAKIAEGRYPKDPPPNQPRGDREVRPYDVPLPPDKYARRRTGQKLSPEETARRRAKWRQEGDPQ